MSSNRVIPVLPIVSQESLKHVSGSLDRRMHLPQFRDSEKFGLKNFFDSNIENTKMVNKLSQETIIPLGSPQ